MTTLENEINEQSNSMSLKLNSALSRSRRLTRLVRQLFCAALVPAALLLAASPNLHAQDTPPGYSIMDVDPNLNILYLDERGGSVTVTVNRQGDFNVPSTVHYRVTTNNATWGPSSTTAGVDFLPTEGTLTFGASDTNQTFTVTLRDDSLIEGDEDFFIVLDEATGGVPIHTPEVRVIIRDGERNPVRVDPDFKPDWPIGPASSHPLRLAVQPTDGKILLVPPADRVNGEDGPLVLRLLPDGQSDPGWQVPAISGSVDFLVLQGNGQVLIAGTTATSPDFVVNGVPRRHLARLNADGSLDTAFSVTLPTNTIVSNLAVQSNGLILAGVSTNGAWGTVLFRLDATGSLDPTFKPPAFGSYEALQIFPTPDGGVFVTGYDGRDMVRLNPDGSRDESFQLPPHMDCWLQAVQPDGRLLVRLRPEDNYFDPSLARLTASGQLDASFTLFPPFTISFGAQVLPTAKGKIWILDRAPGGYPNGVLRRIHADGSDDPSWPIAQLRGDHSMFRTIELRELPDGNLLLAQNDRGLVNGQPRAGLARLLVNAPLPRFEVDPASARVPENSGKVPITLVRCGTNTEPVSVTWKTEGGTAKPGFDYVAASGTVSFPANESVATLELEVLDNAVPDEDRTVRLRLQGPPPESQEYPLVEITIVNDDLGFLPNGIKRLPNGRVLLRPAHVFVPLCLSCGDPTYAYIEASENLRNWTPPDLGGDDTSISLAHPEVIDKTAPTNLVRLYRLRRDSP